MQNYIYLYPNIIKAREKKFTQKQLADELGISQQDVSRYETGKIKAPINYLLDLSKACNVSIEYIIGKENCDNKVKLTEEQAELLNIFNKLPDIAKGKLIAKAEDLAEQYLNAGENAG